MLQTLSVVLKNTVSEARVNSKGEIFKNKKTRASICEQAHSHPHSGWHRRCGHNLQGSCFRSESPLTAVTIRPAQSCNSAPPAWGCRGAMFPRTFLTSQSLLYCKGQVFPQDK